MKSTVINIKTTAHTKVRAQKVADELGFGLSTLINGFLTQLIKTKRIEFFTHVGEEPSEYLLEALEEAKKSQTSRVFDTPEGAVTWLERERKKYARED